MSAPDFRQLNEMIVSLLNLGQVLTDIAEGEETQKKEIREACMPMMVAASRTALEQVPVEELAKSRAGLRVSALRSAGFENLGQIAAAKNHALDMVEGVGEKQIEAIRSILAEFHNNLVEFIPVKISPQDDSPENRQIIRALAAYLRGQEVRQQSRELLGEVLGFISDVTARAEIRSRFRWFFSGSQKKEATEAGVFNLGGKGEIGRAHV